MQDVRRVALARAETVIEDFRQPRDAGAVVRAERFPARLIYQVSDDIGAARFEGRLGRVEQTPHPARGICAQGGGACERRGGLHDGTASERPLAHRFQVGCDILVGPGCRRRAVVGATIGLAGDDLRESGVRESALLKRGGLIDRRAHEWMAELQAVAVVLKQRGIEARLERRDRHGATEQDLAGCEDLRQRTAHVGREREQ